MKQTKPNRFFYHRGYQILIDYIHSMPSSTFSSSNRYFEIKSYYSFFFFWKNSRSEKKKNFGESN